MASTHMGRGGKGGDSTHMGGGGDTDTAYLKLSGGDLESYVNSEGVEGMDFTDGSGLGGA